MSNYDLSDFLNKLNECDNNIENYILKKKRLILSYFLLLFGINSINFPLRINLNDLNTNQNNVILQNLCQSKNNILFKYFNCRSLKNTGINDKKRLQNIIKQMALECNLNIKRVPYTNSNTLNNEKKTKQIYIITN
jgi:hypothetical protein